ncbi:MAG TPA: glycosyl transferase [Thermodesulfobacteriota bacterium]|nr:glycosyl transferase [Thermodesulfobacteriota bacterium]
MADFFQNGEITNLHRLRTGDVERLEKELKGFSQKRPIALVLPALFQDLTAMPIKNILSEIAKVNYLNEIVVTLGRTNKEEFAKVKEMFASLNPPVAIIWNDGENIQELYSILDKEGVSAGGDGKGRSAWIAYGYILARGKSDVIVLHDCDIVTYDRELLGRLCYPVVNPNLDYEFCKGYYARVTNRLHGRVTRLFVTPLIRALKKIVGRDEFLEYLDSFRYILAGEFSMRADLARINRIPGDWGLEVGVLAEVYRNCSLRRICQVEIADNYEHKHQPLSETDPGTGLNKMSIDIAKIIFRTMASMGVIFPSGWVKTLKATYLRTAQDFIAKYGHDSEIDGLIFDRHQEAVSVETFVKGIELACDEFEKDPFGAPQIANWNRVTAAIPNFFDRLKSAVEKDNK